MPPAGQPFYAPLNASYPTKGRITEIMNVLRTMGAHLIRSQTIGVSVGNPLSLMPSLGVFNEQGCFGKCDLCCDMILTNSSIRDNRLGGISSRNSWLKNHGAVD